MAPNPGPTDREAAERSSSGALFVAFFGAVWAAAGASGGATRAILLLFCFAIAVALCVGSVRLRNGARGLPRDDSPRALAKSKRIARRFNPVFGLQGLAIAPSVVLLVRYGLGAFLPVAVALVVGVTSSRWPCSSG